jgi:hypothetical protein
MSQKTPILALRPRKSEGCEGLGPFFDTLPICFSYAESIKKPFTPFTPFTFSESPQESGLPDAPPLEVARPDAPPVALDENRNRLTRLESLLGSEGAAVAIAAAARHIEARNPDFWRRLKKESRHELAICAALLDAGELPE